MAKKYIIISLINVGIAGLIIVVAQWYDAYRTTQSSRPRPTPTQTTIIATPSPRVVIKPSISANPKIDTILLEVPFTAQAPFGRWSDPRQEDGCEEAGAVMAVAWARGETLTPAIAEREIIAISDYEQEQYGQYHDTSIKDTIERIFKGYLHYDNVEARYEITKKDIIEQLQRDNLVVVLANGQKLHNPYYVQPGPLHHVVVVKGYDRSAREFITNDPGTRRGEGYRYQEDVLIDAVYDYPTGHNEPITSIRKGMIIVRKS